MEQRPSNVGIKAIEIYFSSQCVDQTELEAYDGVSAGKYTIGLGQSKMSFCDDREDIYSIALTTLSSLLRKYAISPHSIGRLEVGTETLLDKSKSVKTVLMQLFEGNPSIEGVDTINACYGGTNAVFNSVNWVESSAWDGRDAIVVTGDIAIYQKGAARPSGGAGCVAMLIGPDAPIVFEPGLRGSYFEHTYDFYKPDFSVEYPTVDGKLSMACYIKALDHSYTTYKLRKAKLQPKSAPPRADSPVEEYTSVMDSFDYLCFHTPICQMAVKAYGRMLYNDILADQKNPHAARILQDLPQVDYATSLTEKALEKQLVALTKDRYLQRVKHSILVANQCGNMYSASVYSGLCSLLCNVSSDTLQDKRIGIFSYGSGLASSMFSLRIAGDVQRLQANLNIHQRLESRLILSPQEYDEICFTREAAYQKRNYVPTGDLERITSGTYYLTGVDAQYRRSYAIKGMTTEK